MTVLITGAAGYIGSMTVHALSRLKNPPHVIGVDNLSTGYTCNLPKDFMCIPGDIGMPWFIENVIRVQKVKYIIHCAASVSVPESVADPMKYYDNNTVGSANLLRAAVSCGVEGLVFSSSCAVYGNPEFPRPVREDDTCRPCSPYGWSKLMTEQMLRDTAKAEPNMSMVILRYFNVAGADPLMRTGQTSPAATTLVKRAVQAAVGLGSPFVVHGEGMAVRDYVHVADVANANISAMEYTKSHQGCVTLNVATGKGTGVLELVHALDAIGGKKVPFNFGEPREGDPFAIEADIRAIQDELNWAPQYTVNDMLQHALAWEKLL